MALAVVAWIFFLCVSMLVFQVSGEYSLSILPPFLWDEEIHSSLVENRTLQVVFTSSDWDSMDFEKVSNLGFQCTFEKIDDFQPYGVGHFFKDLCPHGQCVTVLNSTAIRIEMRQVSKYDISTSELIILRIPLGIVPGVLEELVVPIWFVPTPQEPKPEAILASVVYIITTLATLVVLPTSMDMPALGLIPYSSCTLKEQKYWLPSASFAAIPVGGNSFFDAALRIGAFPVFAVVVHYLIVEVASLRMGSESGFVERIRMFFTFVTAELWFIFLPGAAFVCGGLVSSPTPVFQVCGYVGLVILLGFLYAFHSWFFRDHRWEYKKNTVETSSRPVSLLRMLCTKGLAFDGYWEHKHYILTVQRVFPRESGQIGLLGPLSSGLCCFAYVVEAVSVGSPALCTFHRLGLAVTWLIAAAMVVKFRLFRAPFLVILGTALRFLNVAAHVSLFGETNEPWQIGVFYSILYLAIVLAWVRIVLWAIALVREWKKITLEQLQREGEQMDKHFVKIEPDLTEVLLDSAFEPVEDIRGEFDDVPQMIPLVPAADAQEEQQPKPTTTTLKVDEDELDDLNDLGEENDMRSHARSTAPGAVSIAAVGMPTADPAWIVNAARLKPKSSDYTQQPKHPSWFAPDRSSVRTVMLPDLPLKKPAFKTRDK